MSDLLVCSPPPPRALPPHVAAMVWRGHSLGQHTAPLISSGHPDLDAALPGGGWPCQSLTEILQSQAGLGEWRLLCPALARWVKQGGSVLLIGAPYTPYLPAFAREGIEAHRVVRVDVRTPAEGLWATEQALKAKCVTAVLSWLPQARPEQIRRLQACATHHPGLFFAFRPAQAAQESSAAPLRLQLSLGDCPHPLSIQVLKRRGPLLIEPIVLPHWTTGLAALWADAPCPSLVAPQRGHQRIVTPSFSHAPLDGLAARISA